MSESTPDRLTCRILSTQLGVKTERLWKMIGNSFESIDDEIYREDLEENASFWSSSDDAHLVVRLARVLGQRSGPYVELHFFVESDPFHWFAGRPDDDAPRIFAKDVPHNRSEEREVSDLLRHQNHVNQKMEDRDEVRQFLVEQGIAFPTTPLGLDDAERRAYEATLLALRAMRRIERAVLLQRLDGKRGSEETTWLRVAGKIPNSGSVPIAKEVFKVAVQEFMQEYARVTAAILNDESGLPVSSKWQTLTIPD
jgi:hypothetical protein